ncbi:hypothetical protein AN391_00873 [Pseudoalteromonas sp. P1-13-1a]|uniref:TnsD family Tn7-like transposition protein n=1 Tax=Pseudoalteromonas sp. P1-13-1a TaxID=1723756 RepID=UPI0006D662B5|nr:TnsD family Tn7-like transposition protein [Pseudoalteromonas sp. P1-13-1a]KPZ59934.1 hypothetical protein AN391_00873 [Pseudoalteromonas sp. P1-13-1a]
MQLPLSFPDEIIFSRIVRHFTLSGMTCENYLSNVFGNHKVTIHPYLTAGLEQVCKFSHELSLEVLKKQTLAPLFMHFLPSYGSIISNALISSKACEAIRACQLTCVREKEQISIKFCPECARVNAQEFGLSYWHRSHQIPGIESCYLHRVQLEHFSLETRSRLSHCLLPPLDVKSRPSSQVSFDFAQYSYDVLNLTSYSSKSFSLNTFKAQLQKLGYITNKGRYRRRLILMSLYQLSQDLVHDTNFFYPRSSEDYRYISYFLSGKASQHPIKFLLFGFWLTKQAVEKVRSNIVLTESKPAMSMENQCISLLKQGESMASVSRVTGKSRCYIKTLALRFNIPINLKPKYITIKMKQRILLLAKKGFHRKAIASLFQISSGSVEQVISSEPSLVKKRKQFKYESKRRKYKAMILRFIKLQPLAIKQEVKVNCYAAFHWLNVNENEWLHLTLPAPTKPQALARVNWSKRDRELLTKVKAILVKSEVTLSRTKLDKAIGGHGWLTRYANRLPETIKYIEEQLNV